MTDEEKIRNAIEDNRQIFDSWKGDNNVSFQNFDEQRKAFIERLRAPLGYSHNPEKFDHSRVLAHLVLERLENKYPGVQISRDAKKLYDDFTGAYSQRKELYDHWQKEYNLKVNQGVIPSSDPVPSTTERLQRACQWATQKRANNYGLTPAQVAARDLNLRQRSSSASGARYGA
jgi:hypothetical protein